MTYTEAFRQIVERVNASRDGVVDYRPLGVLAKWTLRDKDDMRVVLDSLVMSLKVGVAGKPQPIRTDGKPPQPDDVERVTKQIVDYFGLHPAAHSAH